NRITVGNSAEGDTANTCDFLFDTTDLPASSAALKALIEGAASGVDILIKQGVYDIENSQLPITIPSGCIVSGVGGGNPELGGRGTIILCNNALAVFIVDSLAELRDLGIGLLYTPFAFLTGIGVVELFNLATSRNVRVYTFG